MNFPPFKVFNKPQSMEIGALKIGFSLSSVVALYLGRRYFNGPTCHITKDLTNKIVVITGATSGIGKETATSLAKMHATVILACRDDQKALLLANELRQNTKNPNVEAMHLDLANLRSIKNFSKQYNLKYKKLDILVNNAGVINFQTRLQTKDGFENQFGVNYLGHFYLTNLMLDALKTASSSRVINVTCDAYTTAKINWDDLMSLKIYSPFKAYSQSKLALMLFTQALNKKLAGSNIKVLAVHPGTVKTNLLKDMPRAWYLQILQTIQAPFWYYFTKDVFHGAQPSIYCCVEDYNKLEEGGYYVDLKKRNITLPTLNKQDAEKLWKKSQELLLEKRIVL